MIELTVAVRTTDGSFHHWTYNPPYKRLQHFKRLVSQTFEGECTKWGHVIRALVEARKAARVRLLVAFRDNEPVFEELTYRPRGTTE